MTKDRLEQPDNPAKVKDGAAQSAAEDLAPPAGSQRSEQRARGVLAELESCLATHDLGQMVDFFTEDVVLVGDEEEAFGRNALRDYLRGMAEMAPTVRWDWHRVAVVLDAPGVLSFAAVGTIEFHHAAGQPLGEGAPFRVTCLAVQQDNVWRLRHSTGRARSEQRPNRHDRYRRGTAARRKDLWETGLPNHGSRRRAGDGGVELRGLAGGRARLTPAWL